MKRAVTWLALAVAAHAIASGQDRAPRDAAAVMVLRPARVFDGDAMHEGWAVRVQGRSHRGRRSGGGRRARRREGDRPAGHDAHARADRGTFARPAASVQRDDAGTTRCCAKRSGLRVARGVNHLRATLHGRLHDDPRSRHRRRRLRRRRAQAGRRSGHHSRSAHARRHARDRRDRQLRSEGLRARVARAAGRRGSRRRRARPRRPRSDRPRRRLDQGLRRLPVGPAR